MPCDFQQLPHQGIQTLEPYIPGKSIDELANELGLTDIIKLASNENPFGTSPSVQKALASMTGLDLATYAIATNHPLRQKLADKWGVPKDMLLLGNGSDALIPLLQLSFALHTNKHILTHQYAFIAYQIHAKTLGIPVVTTPLHANWQVNIDAMIQSCHSQTALIFLANPNNPTGVPIAPSEIDRLLQQIPEETIVVLDEAYYEFTDPCQQFNAIAALKKYPNLVVTRTFSKAYGLAGLRLGYLIANPTIISILLRALPPFTVNQAALVAGFTALDDAAFLKKTLDNNREGIEQIQQAFDELKIDYIKTSANFILFRCKNDSLKLYKNLQACGIIVRPLHAYGLNSHLRVTVGTPLQNNRFLDKLKELYNE